MPELTGDPTHGSESPTADNGASESEDGLVSMPFSMAGRLTAVVLVFSLAAIAGAFAVFLDQPEPIAIDSADRGQLQTAPGGGTYRYWITDTAGLPVRWNPCDPIPWVLNAEGAPADAQALMTAAFDRLALATGLNFQFEGTTTETPSRVREPYQPDLYGDQWAPILIAWDDPNRSDLLGARDRGVAVPIAVPNLDGASAFVSAQVVFSTVLQLAPTFGKPGSTWGPTVLHELGHVVGLDHVSSINELMYQHAGRGPSDWGPGDQFALSSLGASAGCFAAPDARDVDVVFKEFRGR